ncbi:MAG TPA: hypothetical protein VJT31_28260 [Rugosimonospora sp.]|nr:hypothetical protein [Rugosimonospora sp.]
MSPRRNHRRDDGPPLDEGLARRGVQHVQVHADGDWIVRTIPGGAATKTYRCPGCDQEIRPGVAHVVAWPAAEWGDASQRRHWHTGCWQARDRRRPVG